MVAANFYVIETSIILGNEPIFLLPALLWYEACGTDARSRNRIRKDTTMMFMTYTLPMAAMLIGLATYWMVTKLW